MQDEQKKILEMVHEGTISVEEADELLEALRSSKRPESATASGNQEDVWQEEWDDEETAGFPDALSSFAESLSGSLSKSIPAMRMPRVRVPRARVSQVARAPRPPRVPRARGYVVSDDETIQKNPSFDRLVKLGMYGVSPSFIKELREAGFTDITYRDVVRLVQGGASIDYIKGMRESFGDSLTIREISKLSMFGITPEYVAEIRTVADEIGAEISVRNIIKMGQYGISPSYVREMKEAGLFDQADDDATPPPEEEF